MRKLLLLNVAIVTCFLTIAASASADDRYAQPVADPSADVDVCAPDARCSIEDALDTTKVASGDRILLATGTYTVTSGLNLTAEDAVLKGEGDAADTVINSTAPSNVPALTISGGSEASKFSIVASGQFSKGLNLVDGFVDHLSVTANGSDACTGVDATIVESLCHATGLTVFGAGFQKAAGSGNHHFLFSNSTFIGSEFWYGASIQALGTSDFQISLQSSIIFGTNQTHFILGDPESHIDFFPDHSNYGQIRRKIGSDEQTPEPPQGTNQPLESYPLFTNIASDFTQATGSPTINAGAINERSGDTDLAGNPRVQGGAPDIGAFESDYVPPVVTPPASGGNTVTPPPIVLDTIKPTLTISKKPKSKTTSKKLSVSFSASETATYLCKLDKGQFKACTSPYKKSVKAGKHKLQIKATDAAGNVSATTTVKWTVKKKT